MISSETRAKYRATIGIECHVQLKTKTKLFSAVGNDAREAPPNTLVSHIDFGLPGALPVLNGEALHLATRAAFALDTEPARFSKFDRKHYFYPDLPKGYQISQFDEPIIGKGSIVIEVDGEEKTIGITRAHLEEDAGKSVHPDGKDYSLVDLNRAGTPLLEIVSEPDLHTGAEAKAYARELYLRMRYADVSEADLYYGNMRFDVNVSVSQTDELGTRSETKNLNSFRAVEKAVNYEINRQIELLEKGGRVVQETRGWDDAKQKTFSQRTKENADDYRYMPDPDLPPIVLDNEYVAKIKGEMPKLPPEIRKELSKYDLGAQVIEDILDNPDIHKKLSEVIAGGTAAENIRRIAYDSLEKLDTLKIPAEAHVKVAESVRANILNSTSATEILDALLENAKQDVDELIQGNAQVSDEGEIAKIVAQVLSGNAKAAEDVKNGEMKAIGFLVGQVMKLSQGKANPQMAQELIKKQLGL
ncbi:MAG TPA: Asp-tRNA(Asn)/Glu-tRNA(Gln) amidotransferase subunit GatB [Verrucomicrobiae bacterium]|nr:Asp-tRNA(Asn)/Glu-tRNA(Gln) amidotransferase subunit GatB [Verrucomicrobiae bacterium]